MRNRADWWCTAKLQLWWASLEKWKFGTCGQTWVRLLDWLDNALVCTQLLLFQFGFWRWLWRRWRWSTSRLAYTQTVRSLTKGLSLVCTLCLTILLLSISQSFQVQIELDFLILWNVWLLQDRLWSSWLRIIDSSSTSISNNDTSTAWFMTTWLIRLTDDRLRSRRTSSRRLWKSHCRYFISQELMLLAIAACAPSLRTTDNCHRWCPLQTMLRCVERWRILDLSLLHGGLWESLICHRNWTRHRCFWWWFFHWLLFLYFLIMKS